MLKPCWELKKCERGRGGKKTAELGACPAYPNNGYSCWIVAGTFCDGEPQGSFAQKERTCLVCEVYATYSTSHGDAREQLRAERPEEFAACVAFFRNLRRTPAG